jgi:hypothetical protein
VLIPGLHYFVLVALNYSSYGIEFFWTKTVIFYQYDGRQPKFADHLLSLNMHMHLLNTIKAEKEKAIGASDFLDRWHIVTFLS